MSWDVKLISETGRIVEVKRHFEGGTYVIEGTSVAELNITYNYSTLFREYLHPDGLKWIHGKKAREVLPAFINSVDQLGNIKDEDYWKDTKGNAGFALSILARWAKANPDAMFLVS